MMARMLIAFVVGWVAFLTVSLPSPVGLAREMQAGEHVLLDEAQSPRLDPRPSEAYQNPQETPEPYPPTTQAMPLISLVLLAALLVVIVVGVCLRFCLRRNR